MGHHCNHGHHTTTADVWTQLGAVGEVTSGLISNTYWLGGLIDLAFQLDEQALGLSWYGLSFGSALAIVTAAGAAYSHSILNINHQNGDDEHHHDDESVRLIITEDVENGLLEQNKAVENDGSLSWIQKAALAGDFLTHSGDVAGPFMMGSEIILDTLKPANPLLPKILVECGATLFGGLASIANVRTCYHSIVKRNKETSEQPDPAHAVKALSI